MAGEKIKKMIDNLNKLTPQRMEKLALLAVKVNENVLIDMNIEQLMNGLDRFGKAIDPGYRSVAYAEFKLRLNPKGVVDLKLEGDFHKSIFINADNFPIRFGANDPKAPELLATYGNDVLGVPYASLNEFARHYVLDFLQDQIYQAIRV